MRTRLPTDAQFDIAAEWLRNNEGRDGEADACKTVAAWLDALVTGRRLRKVARDGGVPVRKLRRKLAELEKK